MTTDQATVSAPSVPHSREAEEGALGAVLINPDVYVDLAAFLKADDFYIHRHSWIWQAMVRLVERKIPVDLLTLPKNWNVSGSSRKLAVQRISPAWSTRCLRP